MKNNKSVSFVIFALAAATVGIALALTGSAPSNATHHAGGQTDPPTVPTEPPKVDVVFALDTTGSMSGLIDGAKQKIWTIATKIIEGQPRPDLRIGLVGYRDRGDEYITRVHSLTPNIDEAYEQLQRFQAAGGGDGPEHVNQALADAIRTMQWRKGDRVLKIVFLVGDAPPHNEYADGLDYTALAREASQKGIFLNTVRCGGDTDTAQVWKAIALAGKGEYTSIDQTGGMVAVATPYDEELRELNMELSRTLIPVGDERTRRAAEGRAVMNAAMAPAAQAASAGFRAKSGRLDTSDLLGALDRGASLDDFAPEKLPAELAAKPKADREVHVRKAQKKRAAINAKVLELSKKRDAFVKQEEKKRGGDKGFDYELQGMLEEQAASVGVAY